MTAARVGLFGLLGSGNLGNDGSLEAVLGYLRAAHPEAAVDALCGGPETVTARYAIPATRLHWYRGEYRTASRAGAIAGKGLGKVVDAFRTAAWVRRHDVVIVPGMGVLEATLPLRPWGFPYALFLLCASGRLLGTRVAQSASAPARSATGRPGPWCAGRRGWPPTGRTATPRPAPRCGRWAWTPRGARSTRTSRSPCPRPRGARPASAGPAGCGLRRRHGLPRR